MNGLVAASLPASLAGRFQEALDACETAGLRCETPAVVLPPSAAAPPPPRVVQFDLPDVPSKAAVPGTAEASGGVLAWLLGKKGWLGAMVGLVLVALLAAAAMYVRKHVVRPLLFGGGKKEQARSHEQAGPMAVPPPPVIPAFAKKRVRFREKVVSVSPEVPPEPLAVPSKKAPRKASSPKQKEPPVPMPPSPPPSDEEAEDPGFEPI